MFQEIWAQLTDMHRIYHIWKGEILSNTPLILFMYENRNFARLTEQSYEGNKVLMPEKLT